MPPKAFPLALRGSVPFSPAIMDRDMVVRAFVRFRGRIKAVIEANGDFIE